MNIIKDFSKLEILRGIAVILFILFVIYSFDHYIGKNKEKELQNNLRNEEQSIVNASTITNSDIRIFESKIQKFINYCKDNQLKEAYTLLSEDCKRDLYPSISDFTNQYYNKMFKNNYDIEIEYEKDKIFKITFYEDILEAGKIENRDSIVHYYKIEQKIVEDKLYINYSKKDE